MQLVILPLAASLLSLACAQNAFKIPKEGLSLAAGQPTTLTWDPTTPGTVSLFLRSGASSALDQGVLIEGMFCPPSSQNLLEPRDDGFGSHLGIIRCSMHSSIHLPQSGKCQVALLTRRPLLL